tara:strand:- start:4941 stop:5651 length:711 start_codon:yes stop_codon:yes gene_type:complete
MSNYSKTTDFAAKDALSTGNANKIVKGTEIDDEFSAIQTAVNTKADLSSPTLTGTPAAPTASAATNSTQIGTTAYVTAAITAALAVAETARRALFPVGTIYTQAAVATNPATLLGFGTWTAFGTGRVLIGLDASNTLMDSVEETGGSADSPSIGANTGATALSIAQMPAHTHSFSAYGSNGTDGVESANKNDNFTNTETTTSTGSGATHTHTQTSGTTTNANYQPFITVYMWKRTA